MQVLVMFESSGAVREAFRRLGFDAWSLDLLPADDETPHHLQRDAEDYMALIEQGTEKPEMVIAHPPCTYLTVSAEWAYKDGPFHMNIGEDVLTGADRRAAREDALDVVERILELPVGKIALENPVGAIPRRVKHIKPQYIQPYQFGHSASKKTGLWLKGLPKLQPTCYIEPEYYHDGKPRWANQAPSGATKLGPSADRWKVRSKTYTGIAHAMAEQWGKLL